MAVFTRAVEMGKVTRMTATAAMVEMTETRLDAPAAPRRIAPAAAARTRTRRGAITTAAQDVVAPLPANLLSGLPAWAAAHITALEQLNRALVSRLATANRLAHTDDISGLPNHRAAVAMLIRVLQRHQRSQQPFAVLFLDGDNLKRYNDLSYEDGNQMIARLAAVFTDHLRPGDYLARWLSGDEFLVVLPGANSAAAARVAERLRSAIERTFFDSAIPVTVSVGIAMFPEDGKLPESLLHLAALSNAEAKRRGKNQVVASSPARLRRRTRTTSSVTPLIVPGASDQREVVVVGQTLSV